MEKSISSDMRLFIRFDALISLVQPEAALQGIQRQWASRRSPLFKNVRALDREFEAVVHAAQLSGPTSIPSNRLYSVVLVRDIAAINAHQTPFEHERDQQLDVRAHGAHLFASVAQQRRADTYQAASSDARDCSFLQQHWQRCYFYE